MTDGLFVEFETGPAIANDYINKLHLDEQPYSLHPVDEQQPETKRFVLHQQGKGVACVEIVLHENGTWTSLMTVPVHKGALR